MNKKILNDSQDLCVVLQKEVIALNKNYLQQKSNSKINPFLNVVVKITIQLN
jgi:hypothetical protein